MKKNNQHADFPSGHPPEYYPRLSLVNFIERTGYGSLKLIWPIILVYYDVCITSCFLLYKCILLLLLCILLFSFFFFYGTLFGFYTVLDFFILYFITLNLVLFVLIYLIGSISWFNSFYFINQLITRIH